MKTFIRGTAGALLSLLLFATATAAVAQSVPVVTVSARSLNIIEGANATFVLTATPAPSAAIKVDVNVNESGGFISGGGGTRYVNIGTSGTVTFTVGTDDDNVAESDGIITATVLNYGNKYTPGTPSSATVNVSDNDLGGPSNNGGPHEVTIAPGRNITEGQDATFTLTANPAPSAAINVDVYVSDSGDFISSGGQGSRTVEIGTSGKATFTVETDNDNVDEPDGEIYAKILHGVGYNRSIPASATVAVKDNDRGISVRIAASRRAITEGEDATFTLTASPSPQVSFTVRVDVVDSGNYTSNREAGRRFVEIGTNGRATFTVGTDNNYSLASGEITATVLTDTGYSPGSPASATVAVNAADLPMVSITGGGTVKEGTSVRFTLTAKPAPRQLDTLRVELSIAESVEMIENPEKDRAGQFQDTVVRIGRSGRGTFTIAIKDSVHENTAQPRTITVTVIPKNETIAGFAPGDPDCAAVVVVKDGEPDPVGSSVVSCSRGVVQMGESAGQSGHPGSGGGGGGNDGGGGTGSGSGGGGNDGGGGTGSGSGGGGVTTPTSAQDSVLPEAFTLSQNYPNPFNPSTAVTYTLPVSGPVELSVYDLTGRIVKTLVDGVRPAGSHTVRFEAGGLPSGIYVYRLRAGSETFTRSMILMR